MCSASEREVYWDQKSIAIPFSPIAIAHGFWSVAPAKFGWQVIGLGVFAPRLGFGQRAQGRRGQVAGLGWWNRRLRLGEFWETRSSGFLSLCPLDIRARP